MCLLGAGNQEWKLCLHITFLLKSANSQGPHAPSQKNSDLWPVNVPCLSFPLSALLLELPNSTFESYLPLQGLTNSLESSTEWRFWCSESGVGEECSFPTNSICCYGCWLHTWRTATLWHQAKGPLQKHLPSSPTHLSSVTYSTWKLIYTTQMASVTSRRNQTGKQVSTLQEMEGPTSSKTLNLTNKALMSSRQDQSPNPPCSIITLSQHSTSFCLGLPQEQNTKLSPLESEQSEARLHKTNCNWVFLTQMAFVHRTVFIIT